MFSWRFCSSLSCVWFVLSHWLCVGVNGWTLTFIDNFDSLNTSVWSAADNFTHSSYPLTPTAELQLYTRDNVYVEDGKLVLRTKYDPAAAAKYGHNSRNYTSGWVESSSKTYIHPTVKVGFSQTFGRWEIRAKLPNPKFPQIWPALWMMPEPKDTVPPNLCWPAGGEIDIMEMWGGKHNNRVQSSFHWTKAAGKQPTNCGSTYDAAKGNLGFYPKTGISIDWSANFHVWAFEWTSNSFKFFVDDILIGAADPTTIVVPHTPFYMIFNTAICGGLYCRVHAPQPKTTVFHYIDWVKVYN